MEPPGDKSQKYRLIEYALSFIWLPSDERVANIDRFMHYILHILLATTTETQGKAREKDFIL